MNHLDEALKLLEQAEAICRKLKNLDGLRLNLGNQALVLRDQALAALESGKEIDESAKHLNNWGLLPSSSPLLNPNLRPDRILAYMLVNKAMRLLQEQSEICTELENHEALQASLRDLAETRELLRKLDGVKDWEKDARSLTDRG